MGVGELKRVTLESVASRFCSVGTTIDLRTGAVEACISLLTTKSGDSDSTK